MLLFVVLFVVLCIVLCILASQAVFMAVGCIYGLGLLPLSFLY